MGGKDVLGEFDRSGLALERLPGSSAKLRLALDLAAEVRRRPLKVLDVGCAGPEPLNVWEPFLPLADRLELTGVDVAGLDRTERRAAELGLAIELRPASAVALTAVLAPGSFDAVVSTQVLERVREWRRALTEMAAMLRPGGRLYLTCDAGDHALPYSARARLVLKRLYSRLPGPLRVGGRSGEWRRRPRLEELREATISAGLEVERLEPYAIRQLKEAQRHAGSETRRLWLALEEALRAEAGERLDGRFFCLLYLRALRP